MVRVVRAGADLSTRARPPAPGRRLMTLADAADAADAADPADALPRTRGMGLFASRREKARKPPTPDELPGMVPVPLPDSQPETPSQTGQT